MKKIILFFFLMLVVTTGFADNFVLDNKTSNFINNKKSKMVIQWADSAKDVEESNNRIKQGKKLNPHSLHLLTQKGKINLDIPKNAKYFRILAWSKDEVEPDLLTNWVDIIPGKIYTLNEDQLIPLVLMSGMGC